MNERKRQDRWGQRCSVRFLLMGLLILCLGAIGGTAAFLTAKTDSIVNRFHTAHVSCQVEEDFDGQVKRDIAVRNTGTAPVYVRVKLVSYRVNEKGEIIGGQALVPEFQLGEGWRDGGDDIYYYQYPLDTAPGGKYLDVTGGMIAGDSQMVLMEYPEEEGGGRQVIQVIAEAVQSSPMEAVRAAWPKEIADWLSADMRQADDQWGDMGQAVRTDRQEAAR